MSNAKLAHYPPAGADPCSWGSAISRRHLWELTAHPIQLIKRRAAGEHFCAKALSEGSPFGRSQALKTDRLRQPEREL